MHLQFAYMHWHISWQQSGSLWKWGSEFWEYAVKLVLALEEAG